MKKMSILSAGLAAASMLLCGCTSVATFDYENAPGAMLRFPESGKTKKSVAVMPFLDQRAMKYHDPASGLQGAGYPAGDRGSFWLGLIPLLPYGYVDKEVPENSDTFVTVGRFHFNPQEEFADASVQSLKRSGLFGRVIRANSLKQADADYIWQGAFTNTAYTGRILSCGVTYFLSPALWIFGVPNGVSTNELAVKFSLVERATGKTVWSGGFQGHDYIVHWIYARNGRDVSLYAPLLKRALNGALYELSKKLP